MGLPLGFTQVGLNLGLTLNISYHYTTPRISTWPTVVGVLLS